MDQMEVKQLFEIPHEGDEHTRAARRKIDDDIDKLERSIQYLKTKRNELSSISVLPTEVLAKIFILARNQFLEFRVYIHQAAWIIVGHVCHHWRQVALGCPHLWSVPVFTKPDLAQEMIQRSKMAALTIKSDASTWTPRMLEELGNAMTQIHRIQSIDLTPYCHPPKLKTIFSPLSQPAPLLEDISLNNPADSADGYQFSFPTDALSNAPRLRSINFFRLNCSWESAIFRHKNLINLRLTTNPAATNGASTIGQMMDVLHHLPNLFVLALDGSIPSHMTSNGSEKAFEFKFLEYLELRGEALDCIFLFRHIQYPSCATVRLHSLSTTVEAGATIFSLIGQNLRRAQSIGTGALHPPVIIQSQLRSEFDRTPEITFFNKVDGMKRLYIPSGACGPTTTIRLGGYGTSSEACGPLLSSLYNCFDLSSLQELHLHWSFTDNEVHTVQDTIGKLPKLKIINMSGSLPEICAAIAETPRPSTDEGPEAAQTRYPSRRKPQDLFPPASIFPALTTFVIGDVGFHPENMERLIDMLMKRSDMNLPINRLRLEHCRGVEAHQKRRLGELVVNLEIEGDGDYSDDSLSDEDEDGGDYPNVDDHFSDDPSD